MTKSDSPQALQPHQIVEVPFYGQMVLAAVVDPQEPLGRAVYVPIRPLCDGLELNWSGQQQRIRRDPVLSRHARIVCLTHTNPAGGNPNMLCLRLDRVNGWLFGINAARVKGQETREQVIRYQEELHDVIFEYCARRASAKLDRMARELPGEEGASQLVHDIRETRIGIDGVLDFLERRMRHDDLVRKLLELLRLDLHDIGGLLEPGDVLTERQRLTIYQLALETVALHAQLGELTGSLANPFPKVFGGLKKRFDVPTYRQIPREQYRDAHEYLTAWKADVQTQIRVQGDTPCIL